MQMGINSNVFIKCAPPLLTKDAVGQSRPLGECRGKRGTPGLGSLHGMVLVRKEVPGQDLLPRG